VSEISEGFAARGLAAALRRLDARSRQAVAGMALRTVFYGSVAFLPCAFGPRSWAEGTMSIATLSFLGASAAFIIARLRGERLDAPNLNYWTEGLLLLAIGLLARIAMRHFAIDG
jgi:hypothetical protein